MTDFEKERNLGFIKLVDSWVLLLNMYEKTYLGNSISIPLNSIEDIKSVLSNMSFTVQNMGDQFNFTNSQVSNVSPNSSIEKNNFNQQNVNNILNVSREEVLNVLKQLKDDFPRYSSNVRDRKALA